MYSTEKVMGREGKKELGEGWEEGWMNNVVDLGGPVEVGELYYCVVLLNDPLRLVAWVAVVDVTVT